MQPSFSPSRALRRFLLLCLLPVAFAACDRHSAGEPPEAYGHGSSHTKSFDSHAIDSSGTRHFSDSTGTDGKTEGEPAAEKAEPAENAKRLNTSGQ